MFERVLPLMQNSQKSVAEQFKRCIDLFHCVSLSSGPGQSIGTTLTNKGPVALSCPHVIKFGLTDETRSKCNNERLINPPIARVDDLYWLRDDSRSNEAILNHLREENKFTEQKTEHLKSLQAQIYREHIAHLEEDHDSVPYKYINDAKFAYFTRERKGLPYEMFCRVPSTEVSSDNVRMDEKEHVTKNGASETEIILDLNKLAKEREATFCEVISFLPHPSDDSVFAYSVDFTGSELYEICFIGTSGPYIHNTSGDFMWIPKTYFLLYVTRNAVHRPDKVWIHNCMGGNDEDICIFDEPDELFEVSISLSLCKTFVLIEAASAETTETHVISLKNLGEATMSSIQTSMHCVQKRRFGCKYSAIPHPDGHMYILSNANDAINNQVLHCSFNETHGCTDRVLFNEAHKFDVLVPHNPERLLESMIVFENFIILEGRESGLSQIWILDTQSNGNNALQRLKMPDPTYFATLCAENYIFDTEWIRFRYSTPRDPIAIKCFNVQTKEHRLLQKENVGNYDPDDYKIHRATTTSFDGTKVDISMIMKKDLSKDETHPLLLYGYGSYGACMEPRFRRHWIPYLQRGMICCVAHIRGGSENGNSWYETDGKYLTKRNTFMDFIACAEHLIEDGWTSPKQIAIEGRSAGGLLVGSVLNMRPDLFQVAVAAVPFVDVMTTMCDCSIPLTEGEWEEWGNPNEYKFHDYMLSYSPIDNVRAQNYPNVLILAGLHDQRVQYWEPVKWATKLRCHTTGDNDILAKIDMNAGHFSASDRYQYLQERAFEQAYVISKLY